MRLLHLIPSLSAGGAERQLQYLVRGLTDRGHSVHVAYLRAGPDPLTQVRAQLHRIDARGNYDPRIVAQLWRLMAQLKPDIVQTWIMQMDVLGGLVATARGERWIIREPNEALAYRGSWKFRVREIVGRHADAIVCNSTGGRQYWAGAVPARPVFVVGNALPVEAIELAQLAVEDLPELEPARPVVVYAGRLIGDHTSDKNLLLLLRALCLVKERMPIRALFCGEGPQRLQLEREIEDLGLRGTVKLTGHLPKERLWGLLKRASVFVSVSRFEGMPNSLMEAIAAGCPVVASDIGAHRALLSDHSALFVSADRADAIADAILNILAATGEARARAARAVERARAWDLSTMAADYERVYEIVLAARQAARR